MRRNGMHDITSMNIINREHICCETIYTNEMRKKIDDVRVEYAIIYMENEIYELERAARLLRRRHPLF